MNTIDSLTAESGRDIGPQRFQHDDVVAHEGGVIRALAAGLVLAVLVAGVPAGLLLLGGTPPIPTSLPTRDDLTGTIGAEQLVGVLLWVAWLAWLQFTLCVLVELRSAIRGIGLPRHVPLSGPTQRLARVLVASVIVAVSAVGPASAAVAPDAHQGHAATRVVVEAAPVVEGAQKSSADAAQNGVADVAVPDGDAVYMLGDRVLDPAEAAGLVGQKVYVVQPPAGRYHDNLWDIAERTLGDGRRYQEIYELNRGRTQPDGHELSLARLIYPNWLLIMPADAAGVDVVTAEVPAPEPAPPDAPVDAPAGDDAGTGSGAVDHEIPDSGVGVHESGYRDLVEGGLLAAGVLAAIEAVRRRRRTPEPSDDAIEAEVALRIGADPDRARWLNHALRHLAAACRGSGEQLPPVYAAVVDDRGVDLLLAPPRGRAPEPWRVSDEGRLWRLERSSVRAGDGVDANVLAPYPGLVSVGRDGDRDVLVDLEAAGGPISVVGDPAMAYEVVTAIAVELATNHWSDHLVVTAEGLPGELGALDHSRVRLVPDVASVLPELRGRRSDRLGTDVLSGRLRPGGGGGWMPEYVVLGAAPDPAVARELVSLTASSSRAPLGVVCAGELPGARWTLSVDAAGALDVSVLGITVRANRLTRHSLQNVATLIDPDHDGDGQAAAREAWLPEVRPAVPEPAVPADVAALATAPVRIFVLGPAEVQAGRDIDEQRRALATEIVVHLTLHREGVHPTVLAAAIWPRGVTLAVQEATIARVRDWLGTDAEGSPYLRTTVDGRLVLSDEVMLDWDVVCALLEQSRRASSVDDEMRLLRRALRVARGPVLDDRPQGRYAWLARARLERLASDVLVDAAHRLSVLCNDGGEPGTAAAAARAGLRVRPVEQLLWRDLLLAQQSVDGRSGVLAVTEEMTITLGGIGVADLEPETMALLDELLPGGAPESTPLSG